MMWVIGQAMPAGPEMLNALATIATSVGLSSALLLFFVWQSWKREERLTTRLETLEDFSRKSLIELTEKTTSALIKDAEATFACTEAIRGNTIAITNNIDSSKKVEQLIVEHHSFTQKFAEHLAKNHHSGGQTSERG